MYIVIFVYNNFEGILNILFYIIKILDGYQVVLIINFIRKFVYDKFIFVIFCGLDLVVRVVNFNWFLFSDDVYCFVMLDENYKIYYVCIDKECMCFFIDQFQWLLILIFLFWKESDDFVVECVCMINNMREIKLECMGVIVKVKVSLIK